jgi:hypothetical protein
MHTMIRKTLLALTFAALCATPALADQPSLAAVKAIENSERVVLTRVCQESKLKNWDYAVRCYAVSQQLNVCIFLATNAGTYRDLKNEGQTTYPELQAKLDNASGADVVTEENGLSLTELAPATLPSGQLVLAIYKQCASYVVVH